MLPSSMAAAIQRIRFITLPMLRETNKIVYRPWSS